ncbi:MAG: phosphotransferase enzyme family protein [Acidimicrobiales bacterium]
MQTGPGEQSDGSLGGGNMNMVFREGDTVVRHAGVWTPSVHRYLEYLRLAGIDWVPSPVGIDRSADGEPERERLSYLSGDVPAYPLPDWVWADEVLGDGAQCLRRLHDASVGFSTDGAIWQSPTKIPPEVVCHNDFAPHNLVFRDGRIVGAIDFDFCSPGPRLWDIAYFATRIVPLTSDPPRNAPGMDQARQRMQMILGAYGHGPAITFEDVVRVAIIRLHDLADLSRRKADELRKPQLLDQAKAYDRDGHYLATLRL